MLETSESIDKIAPAMLEAQKKIDSVNKDRTANIPGKDGKRGYTYAYADLADCFSVVKPPLNDAGISIVQTTGYEEGKVIVTTTLLHQSGQYLRSSIVIPGARDAHSVGSALTYGKRYSICAMTGLATDVDDDGKGAMGDDDKRGRQPQPPSVAPRNQNSPENNTQQQTQKSTTPARDALKKVLVKSCQASTPAEEFAAIQGATEFCFHAISDVYLEEKTCVMVYNRLKKLRDEGINLATLKHKKPQG